MLDRQLATQLCALLAYAGKYSAYASRQFEIHCKFHNSFSAKYAALIQDRELNLRSEQAAGTSAPRAENFCPQSRIFCRVPTFNSLPFRRSGNSAKREVRMLQCNVLEGYLTSE